MLEKNLLTKLKNKVFRSHFVSAQVRRLVTSQIRELRESKPWTQTELGQKAGMKPNAISRLENPNYGDFTINTLLRLAEAFDVGLIVRFAPFSELVAWNKKVSPGSYTPPSFSNDRKLFATSVESFQNQYYRSEKIVPPVPHYEHGETVKAPGYWRLENETVSISHKVM